MLFKQDYEGHSGCVVQDYAVTMAALFSTWHSSCVVQDYADTIAALSSTWLTPWQRCLGQFDIYTILNCILLVATIHGFSIKAPILLGP